MPRNIKFLLLALLFFVFGVFFARSHSYLAIIWMAAALFFFIVGARKPKPQVKPSSSAPLNRTP
jgi:hypothetical protein